MPRPEFEEDGPPMPTNVTLLSLNNIDIFELGFFKPKFKLETNTYFEWHMLLTCYQYDQRCYQREFCHRTVYFKFSYFLFLIKPYWTLNLKRFLCILFSTGIAIYLQFIAMEIWFSLTSTKSFKNVFENWKGVIQSQIRIHIALIKG